MASIRDKHPVVTTVDTPQKLPWFPWIGKKRPFYGWVIVVACSFTSFARQLTSPPAFATYLAPLQKEFGWSRAILAGPRSLSQAEDAIFGPLEGFLMDRLGPRIMVVVGSLTMSLGLILFGLTHSLWMFFLSNIIIALGNGFIGVIVMSVAINHWFRRKRTLAQAVVGTAFGMVGIVGIPTLVLIQVSMGWRTSAVLTGLLILAVGLSCSMLFRRSPEPYGLLPDGDVKDSSTSAVAVQGRPVVEEYSFTLREALHTRTFWLLAAGQAMSSLGLGAVQVHLYLHMEQVGLTRTTVAFVWTVASITIIPARFLGSFFEGRLSKNIILGAVSAITAVSVFILGIATSPPMALAFAVVHGIGLGARGPVQNAMQGDYFGRKSQGTIRGWLTTFAVPVTIIAPVMAGYMADVLGSYRLVFITMSFVALAGAVLFFLATSPEPPAQKAHVSGGS